ncbi:uncharacterized protein BXZ73DRAFT_87270 [Epithele typhae]|uniref:uncharacterized protein n=1 Tax=Epithele typhae TaxID=378194 RepID=UPI002007E969|nr:uncharacterized protein BXZ73DRAFT_87270 [Epithele typhae]KAH9944356.1 hypothetical protein BXZ73DRAFT_87270 [Epithele typhae]
MFFSSELLERRDSGYGLLWLAATLGAKSSFKSLPKRSVLNADISQLCGLIAEPPEPLALRLSSNLMIGNIDLRHPTPRPILVLVKEDIFYADVTTCFNSLKKAVQEMTVVSASAAQLQMGQPTLRAEAITLAADPAAAFSITVDGMFLTWGKPTQQEQDSDDDFDPKGKKPRSTRPQGDTNAPSSAVQEQGRALHTLDDRHRNVLFGAIGASLTGSIHEPPGFAASSSQAGGGFSLDDIFDLPEGATGIDIGDELARELGEGWGGADLQPPSAQGAQDLNAALAVDMGDMSMHDDFIFNPPGGAESSPPRGEPMLPGSLPSPHLQEPLPDVTSQPGAEGQTPHSPQRKAKRARLQIDRRIELTDEELKTARANYVQMQEHLNQEVAQKKMDRDANRIIEEMICGAPRGVEAPLLVDFWLENFRLHVGARSGKLHIEMEGEPPRKRLRIHDLDTDAQTVRSPVAEMEPHAMDVDQTFNFELPLSDHHHHIGDEISRMRSSEEPGQARRGSRPPSALGSHLGINLEPAHDIISGSQRSALFPWDHAGPSSSVGGGAGDAWKSASKRNSSHGSRRESFAIPADSNIHSSPVNFDFRSSVAGGDDFHFNVPDALDGPEESQQSNILTLEKNSFNYLEYVKMQISAMPTGNQKLCFEDVVPSATSTRRVAAAAFYHCLVLATKDMLSVRQDEPYGEMELRVK